MSYYYYLHCIITGIIIFLRWYRFVIFKLSTQLLTSYIFITRNYWWWFNKYSLNQTSCYEHRIVILPSHRRSMYKHPVLTLFSCIQTALSRRFLNMIHEIRAYLKRGHFILLLFQKTKTTCCISCKNCTTTVGAWCPMWTFNRRSWICSRSS